MKYKRKSRPRRKMDRSDADIMAAKQMFNDVAVGIKMPLKHYDEISDRLCGKPSRNLY